MRLGSAKPCLNAVVIRLIGNLFLFYHLNKWKRQGGAFVIKEQPIPLVLAIVLLAGCTGESVNTPDEKMEPIPNVPGEI